METARYLTNSVVDDNPTRSGNAATDAGVLLASFVGDPFEYRVDKTESHNAYSKYTGIRTALIQDRAARAFTERLANGQSVFIRVLGVNGYIDVQYDIDGLRQDLERVAQKCGDNRLAKRLSRAMPTNIKPAE